MAPSTVAVLGAVGPDKGARRLERLAELVRDAGVPVRFVLIGYMDVEHGPWQSDDAVLTVHGRYEPRELPDLLAHYRVRLVAFPSAGPETFSFTLSEAWAAGLPVVVPPFGALAERVAGTGAGWLWTDAEWRDEAKMLARMAELVAPGNSDGARRGGRARPARLPQPTPADDGGAHARHLRHGCGSWRRRRSAPLDRARVRDALGYAPWTPPVIRPPLSASGVETAGASGVEPAGESAIEPASTAATSFATRLAETALWLGQTRPGRVLSRLAPARVRTALKARLR